MSLEIHHPLSLVTALSQGFPFPMTKHIYSATFLDMTVIPRRYPEVERLVN